MIKRSVIAISAILVASSSFARDYTLVEKNTYGTGIYHGGALVNNKVFINSSQQSIEVFDVSDSTNIVKTPNLSLNCPTSVSQIVKDGNTIAASCGSGIEFFDATDSSNIQSLGTYESAGYGINGITLEGDRLYMLGGNSEVLVFDATDLSNLVELGRASVGSVQPVVIRKSGNFLFAINSYNSLDIYDVSDPQSLMKVSSYTNASGQMYSFEILGNYAYVGVDGALQVVDISNPAAPSKIATITSTENGASIPLIMHMTESSGNIYIATSAKSIHKIELTNPAVPVISNSLYTLDYRAEGLTLDGNILTVFNGIDGLTLLDVSNPSSISLSAHYTQSMSPATISLDQNRAIIGDDENTYHFIELDNDLNISETGRLKDYYNVPVGLLSNNQALVGTNNILHSLDISDLNNPVALEQDTIGSGPGYINTMRQSGNTLFVGLSDGALGIFDNSTGSNTQLSVFDLGADPDTSTYRGILDIAEKDNNLYLTTSQTDLSILNISDLSSASLLAHHDWSSYDADDRSIEIFGNRAFIARDSGLLVVDITDPTNPSLVETSNSFGLPDQIQAIDDRFAVITNSTTTYLVDFADETQPQIVHQINTGKRFKSVAADSTKILASEKFGHTLTSIQINQSPIANDSVGLVDEDEILNDSVDVADREDDAFTITVTGDVSQGSLSVTDSGTYTYQPGENYFGSDSFTYEVTGAYGNVQTATVNITVNSVNDAPSVETDSIAAVEDTVLNAVIVGTDIEHSPLSFSKLSEPESGELVVQSNGELTYTPAENVNGDVHFDVKVNDGELDSATQTITIAIQAVNDKPVAEVSDLTMDEDASDSAAATATDVENDSVTFSMASAASNGTAVVNTDGSYSYQPNPDFNGNDSFNIVANDGTQDSEEVVVNVTVNPVNDAPIATSGSGTVEENKSLTGNLSATDVDGDSLTFAIESNSTNGNLTINTNGSFSYTPNKDFVGNDSFTFSASDSDGLKSTANYSITVQKKPASGGGGSTSLSVLILSIVSLLSRRKRQK